MMEWDSVLPSTTGYFAIRQGQAYNNNKEVHQIIAKVITFENDLYIDFNDKQIVNYTLLSDIILVQSREWLKIGN